MRKAEAFTASFPQLSNCSFQDLLKSGVIFLYHKFPLDSSLFLGEKHDS